MESQKQVGGTPLQGRSSTRVVLAEEQRQGFGLFKEQMAARACGTRMRPWV